MAKVETQTIEVNNHILSFYPNAHRYKLDEKWITSCTTAISPCFDKSAPMMYWAVEQTLLQVTNGLDKLTEAGIEFKAENYKEIFKFAKDEHKRQKEEAGVIGTDIHDVIQGFAEGKGVTVRDKEIRIINGAAGFLRWAYTHNFRPLTSEELIFSVKLQVAGMLDTTALIDLPEEGLRDVLILGDWKTANGVYDSHIVQVAGYYLMKQEMYPDFKVDRFFIMRFDKLTGEFQAVDITPYIESAMIIFRKCVEQFRWMKDVNLYLKGFNDVAKQERKELYD